MGRDGVYEGKERVMYCKVEDCIYNVSGTCGIDTEIDENGKCVWMGCNDEPQTERTATEQLTEQPTEQSQINEDEPQGCIYDRLRDYEYDLALEQMERDER